MSPLLRVLGIILKDLHLLDRERRDLGDDVGLGESLDAQGVEGAESRIGLGHDATG